MPIAQHRLQFTPRLVPTLAALVMVSLTLYLAWWQQERAEQKRVLQAEFVQRTSAPALTLDVTQRDAVALRYRHVVVRGTFQSEGQIFLDNKTDDTHIMQSAGRAGYHVITPLRLAGSNTYVLINRGWLARAASYPKPPSVAVPAGDVEVHGLAVIPNARFLELSNAAFEGNVWQNLTIDRYQQRMKLDVLPVVVLVSITTPDLLPLTEQPNAGVGKHVEYMLTWYSLSATIIALWVGLNVKMTSINVQPNAPPKPSSSSL